jgi:hypothetical protein
MTKQEALQDINVCIDRMEVLATTHDIALIVGRPGKITIINNSTGDARHFFEQMDKKLED